MTFTFCFPTYWQVTGIAADRVVIKADESNQLFTGRVLSYGYKPLPMPYTDLDGDTITGELRITVEVGEAVAAPWSTE